MKNMRLVYLFLFSLLFMACEREYTPPALNEPTYKGKLANITIKQLKDRFKDIKDPFFLEEELVIKGVVSANDESGNIYKQIYIQDGTGGINIGVEQNSVYATYQVGQEVYVNLKELYILKYGGELQVGLGTTNANRISWQSFKEKVQMHSWPNPSNVKPRQVSFDKLTDDLVHQLVEVTDIRFSNGGKKTFSDKDATSNEEIKDKSGKVLIVRTSNYSNFSQDLLPRGTGSLVGILGRFNGAWQLILRTKNDVKEFDGEDPEEVKPVSGSFFKETFGLGTYPSGNRPKINDFKDFDMKSPVQYRDDSGTADIRSVSGDNGAHIWLPANRDASIVVSGINTQGKGEVTLNYQLTANLFEPTATADLNQIALKVNGQRVTVPSKVVSNSAGDNNKWFTISIPKLPQVNNLTIEFISAASENKIGFRLDNIELIGGDGAVGKKEIILIREKKSHD
ncbi:DUF5689 domain-containing protein [Sphingobacterium sp. WM]|nr:DUF5689 domain-containing protein [Sphingobacterium sp. WM]WFB64391.1 DUF5689 domain-containing protein [Sphingobacterium sp. WM]